MVAAISSAEVELANFKFFASEVPSLCARSATCSADSSPETYKTFFELAIKDEICIKSVDFPIPGCPAIKSTPAGKIPPPKTASRSLIPLEILSCFSFEITSFKF